MLSLRLCQERVLLKRPLFASAACPEEFLDSLVKPSLTRASAACPKEFLDSCEALLDASLVTSLDLAPRASTLD